MGDTHVEDLVDDSSLSNEEGINDKDFRTTLQIVVKRVGKGDGDVLCLEVDADASVLDLKTRISEQLAARNDQVPVERQRLVYFGRMLRDNEQTLGESGVKMQAEAVNYVHLSPLPEGQILSDRSVGIDNRPSVTLGALESHLDRARRLGMAARERRIRRRHQPYRNTHEAQAQAVPVDHTSATALGNAPQGATRIFALASMARVGTDHVADTQFFSRPTMRRAVLSASSGPSRVTGMTCPSPVAQLSQLSATVAAAAAESRTGASPRLMQQARQTSTELSLYMPVLQERLRLISSSTILPVDDLDVSETINILEHVSRETRALALVLRGLGLPESTPSLRQSTSSSMNQAVTPTTLERILAEGDDPSIFLAQVPSVYMSSTWFPRMI